MEDRARVGLLHLPTALGELEGWTARNGLGKLEGERRFAQYAVLRAVAESRELSEALSFKGGNALDLVWHPNRSTQDLDFSRTDPGPPVEDLRHQLATALDATAAILGLGLRLQRLRRNPPGPGHDWAAFEGTVGFAFPGNPREMARLRRGESVASVVPIEISCNEVVGARNPTAIGGRFPLHICTLEDIVAEKLRAFLQQRVRNRTRAQDVLDIALLVEDDPGLDRQRIRDFLLQKARARDIGVSREAFHDPELRHRASLDYEGLRETIRRDGRFLEFEEAMRLLLALVDELDL